MRLSRLALALAGALLTVPAAAQKGKPAKPPDSADSADSVVLKNGTMVSGKILDDDPKTGITIKLASGKVRVIPPGDIKLVDRAETAKKDPAPAPAPKDDPPPEKTEEAAPVKVTPETSTWEHAGTHFGAGIDLAMVLSKENADKTLKVLSPAFGAHGSLDTHLGGGFYFRLDALFATFSRTSSVKVVRSVDPTDPAHITIVEGTVTNKVRVYDLGLRPQLGYDWTTTFTSRIGLRVGVDIASGNATDCTGNSRTSLGYGFGAVPIAARLGDKKAIELGVYFDYLTLTTPRCSDGNLDNFVVQPGGVNVFSQKITDEKISVGELGLSGTYMFW